MQVMVDVEQVQRIRGILKQAPEQPRVRVSRCEAIQMLAPEIGALRSKGYSIEQIAGMLAELGLKVSAVRLRESLREARGPRSRKKKLPSRPPPGGAHEGAPRSGPGKAAARAATHRGLEAGAAPVRPAPRGGEDATFVGPRPIGVGAAGSKGAPTPAAPKGTFVPREDTQDL